MIECIKQIAITKRFLPVIVQNRDYAIADFNGILTAPADHAAITALQSANATIGSSGIVYDLSDDIVDLGTAALGTNAQQAVISSARSVTVTDQADSVAKHTHLTNVLNDTTTNVVVTAKGSPTELKNIANTSGTDQITWLITSNINFDYRSYTSDNLSKFNKAFNEDF